MSLHEKEIGAWLFAYGGYARHASTIAYPGGAIKNYGILGANQGVVDANGGGTVNLRSGPGTQYGIVGSVADGSIVTISCTTTGTTHTGRYGSTNTSGQWISDAFVWTGTSNPVAPSCQ
ncbi:SH3 domain-containing protein [Laceyella putida]|uniref:SH3 domain-containing protein n=1 Tax=Laceyella putida TaxID=110101 RepID=A0ABW2RKG9_9BACL